MWDVLRNRWQSETDMLQRYAEAVTALYDKRQEGEDLCSFQ